MATNARPTKIAILVAQRIVRDVRRGAMEPGQLLPPERVMLEKYQIGRGTLREALRLLEFQGVITLKPGPKGGPVLLEPDATHLADSLLLLMEMRGAPYSVIVEMRALLEPAACRLAAVRMTEGDRARLRENVEAMRDNIDDEYAFLTTNKEFHDLIAWGSENPMLGYFTESMTGIMDGTVMDIDYPLPRREAVLKAHEEICQTVEAQNADAAHERMHAHLQAYVEFSQKRYPELLDKALQWGAPSL